MPLRGAVRRVRGSRLQRTRVGSAPHTAAPAPRPPLCRQAGRGGGFHQLQLLRGLGKSLRSARRKAAAGTLGPHDWKENPAANGLVCSAGKHCPSQRYCRTNFDPHTLHTPRKNTPKPKKVHNPPPKNYGLPTCMKNSLPRAQISVISEKNIIKPGQATPLVLHALFEQATVKVGTGGGERLERSHKAPQPPVAATQPEKPRGAGGPSTAGPRTMPAFIAASQMERMGDCQLEPIN